MSDATSDVTWDRLTRACADVAALPGPEREVALRRLSAESPALAEEVRSLLAVDRPMSIDVAGDLGPASPLARGDDAAGLPVDRIGRYRLEARIGRGGSATVYRARTELPPRRVAVKLFDAVAGEGALLVLYFGDSDIALYRKR